jgi:hypothetical protein
MSTFQEPHCDHAQSDNFSFRNTTFASDWSDVHSKNSVDSAVHKLTSTMTDAMNLSIPFVKHIYSSFPSGFSPH